MQCLRRTVASKTTNNRQDYFINIMSINKLINNMLSPTAAYKIRPIKLQMLQIFVLLLLVGDIIKFMLILRK